ncbi:alginate export family protein [Niastella populi]|uniref:Alginate export domain-containing protein n=1 Tax=Niastella populi TaxID=550983 RepID=A0A1V9FV73_9BACT|nr:alginate export family protein [Niastella populi]OQP62269.1 hypothetical protein A4R26_18535 [Niastella populi]
MKWRLMLLLLSIGAGGNCQQLPEFKPLRYDENYSILKNDSVSTFLRKLKYTALSANRNNYISFGGEARLQYLHYKNDLWSDAPEATHGEVLNRYLLHADVHVGKHFRTFAQLQSSLAFSMEESGPLDDNSLELHQGFIEVKSFLNGNGELAARIGRQEFQYGSQRLVSAREGPNNRQSFDGLKLIYKKHDLQANLFYSHYVGTRKGFFNDRPSGNTRFWGAYIVKNGIPVIGNIDLYCLGLLKRKTAFDEGVGRELRHTAGTRIWTTSNDWKYDFEAAYQFGKFGKYKINAYTASINTSYTFRKIKWLPEIRFKTEVISGNKKYDDNYLQTFNPLFPRGGYFGLAALIGPANLIGIHPSVLFTPLAGIHVSLDYDKMWRYSIDDGIYAPGNLLTYTGRNTADKHIGDQYTITFEYALNRYFVFSTVFLWFHAGNYIKEVAPGKNVFFIGITSGVRF